MTEILSLAVVAALIMHSTPPAVSTLKSPAAQNQIAGVRPIEHQAHRAHARPARARRTAAHSRSSQVID